MWFAVNEQTTTWSCPVCEKTLNPEDLIVDGYVIFSIGFNSNTSTRLHRYFDSILKSTPDSVEDVIVEADGQWHTADDHFGSEGWKASRLVREKSGSQSTSSPSKNISSPSKQSSTSNGGAPSAARPEILILDSDDENEKRVKREISPSLASAIAYNSSNGQADVIDLTLSDSDDDPLPPWSSHIPEKRKLADDVGASDKRQRIQIHAHTPLPPVRAHYVNPLDIAAGTFPTTPPNSNGYGPNGILGPNGPTGYINIPYHRSNSGGLSGSTREHGGSNPVTNRFPTLTSPIDHPLAREPRPYNSGPIAGVSRSPSSQGFPSRTPYPPLPSRPPQANLDRW